MDDSDSSSLSSLPSSEDESPKSPEVNRKTLTLKGGKLTAGPVAPVKKGPAPRKRNAPAAPRSPSTSPERETSPPHDYVLADNPDIAVLVMFRSRFAEAFNKNVPNLGPQDVENGVVGEEPSEQVENFLCALLGLVLNRKKYVERGHYGRALEECLQTHRSQWPESWGGMNPLSGNRTFSSMTPTEKITLLKTLTHWALSASEVITNMIKESYKGTRKEDDINQPLSVQPWGEDGRKRRYWLIEGQQDTSFRLYRESARKAAKNTWFTIAGTIDELKNIGEGLRAEGSQAGRRLADRIVTAIPRLEASEEKRKKKEYRIARRAAFSRPEPGFSMYEGRTRGKRMKYTFSDEEDYVTDGSGYRRSARHSSRDTPADPSAPTMTASGRTVRSRFGRSYGGDMRDTDSLRDGSEAMDEDDRPARADGRPRRSGRAQRGMQDEYGSLDELDGDAEDTPSGEEWEGDDDDVEGKFDDEEDDDVMSDDDGDNDSLMGEPRSLIVNLKYKKEPPPDAEMKDLAISRPNGAIANETIGEALKDVSAPSITALAEQPALAPEIDAGVTNVPKQEEPVDKAPVDAAMPDASPFAHDPYTAAQELPSAYHTEPQQSQPSQPSQPYTNGHAHPQHQHQHHEPPSQPPQHFTAHSPTYVAPTIQG